MGFRSQLFATVTESTNKDTHTDSQLFLQHIHYKPVHPASVEQVPGHAPEMSGGAQHFIFAVLVQVLVSSCMYLKHKAHRMERILNLLDVVDIHRNVVHFKNHKLPIHTPVSILHSVDQVTQRKCRGRLWRFHGL